MDESTLDKIQQIADNTQFTPDELIETYNLYASLPFYVACRQNLPGTHYERYNYLWCNLTYRYGSELQEYQL